MKFLLAFSTLLSWSRHSHHECIFLCSSAISDSIIRPKTFVAPSSQMVSWPRFIPSRKSEYSACTLSLKSMIFSFEDDWTRSQAKSLYGSLFLFTKRK
jgi:hypothetical protein